ncbi:MAG: 30S ribosomal protein S13 [Candidatus Aenigmatarchaeota archaeon]
MTKKPKDESKNEAKVDKARGTDAQSASKSSKSVESGEAKKKAPKIGPREAAPAAKKYRIRGGIVRILSTDIDSSFSVVRALNEIKGIGFHTADIVAKLSGIDARKKISELTQEDIKKLEETIRNSQFPKWMVNSTDKHLIGGSIDLKKRTDINLLQKIRAYKGIRHERGLPVRGQRTRSTSRKNKTVGVIKKKAMAAKTGKK